MGFTITAVTSCFAQLFVLLTGEFFRPLPAAGNLSTLYVTTNKAQTAETPGPTRTKKAREAPTAGKKCQDRQH